MLDISAARWFRLSSGGVACDEDGLRVGQAALLQRDGSGKWAIGTGEGLTKVYGLTVDLAEKAGGLHAVAEALNRGDLARAQIAALLLQLPDPPPRHEPVQEADDAARFELARALVASGLLKADADWDAKHPRTGTAPNPGWFAPTDGDGSASPSFFAGSAPQEALRALARFASRISAVTNLFNTVFVPDRNTVVEEGQVPDRSDLSYRWAHDEAQLTFRVLIHGEWRTLLVATHDQNAIYHDAGGREVARVVAADGRRTLVVDMGAIDRAATAARAGDGAPDSSQTDAQREPKLCPDPMPEPKTTNSANSILYQEHVTGLTYGLAIRIGGVYFDGCDPATGDLLEAKGKIDHLFDSNDELNGWVDQSNNPAVQMGVQSQAALDVGRKVVWHAQTERGYRGLSEIAQQGKYTNVSVVFDPYDTGH